MLYLPKNKDTTKYKPYSFPSQLSAPLTLLNASLNTSLTFPTSDPSSIIPQDELYLNNSTNYFNPSTEHNQLITSNNNNSNHNELLNYIYNSYLVPIQHFSNL